MSADKMRMESYTFDASAKTVTFPDLALIQLEAIGIIVNVTDQIIIYDMADTAKGGAVATNVLTLEHDTTTMADGDALYIAYDSHQYSIWKTAHKTVEYMTTGAQTDDDIAVAIGSGARMAITAIDAVLSNDASVDVQCRIGFGAAAVPTEPTSGAAAVQDVILSHPGISAGSGIIKRFDPPMYGNAGNELRMTCDAPTDGQLTIVTSYFTITD